MKRRIIFVIVVAVLLSAIKVFGQEKTIAPDSVITKTELIKKYEAEVAAADVYIQKRILEICLSDPQILKRLNALVSEDIIYARLTSGKSIYMDLIKDLKPKEEKQK